MKHLPGSHDHIFGQDIEREGERRTRLVILITAITMVIEIGAGWIYGSMALLADGLHMGSHAVALAISAFAYAYARRHATDERFNFGAGKVNALGGFAGGVLLAVFALVMGLESLKRLYAPVPIEFNQAIFVAVLGLLVNGACLLILHVHPEEDGHDHDTPHDHDHEHHHHDHQDHDHNLRSAYLHVFADAFTSFLAIFALLGAKYFQQNWLDPFMGIVGAALVTRWSVGLIRTTAGTLLDERISEDFVEEVRGALESESGVQVTDLHVWMIGPGIYAAEIVLHAVQPCPPEYYKDLASRHARIVHCTVEVHESPIQALRLP